MPLLRLGELAVLVELFFGLEAAIGFAFGEQSIGGGSVQVTSLRLEVRSIRAADFRSFVPRQAEPLEGSQDRAKGFVDVPLLIGVVDPQNELPAVVPSPQPIEQRGAHPTDVHVARRAGSKSRSHSHHQSSQ